MKMKLNVGKCETRNNDEMVICYIKSVRCEHFLICIFKNNHNPESLSASGVIMKCWLKASVGFALIMHAMHEY